MSTATRTAVTTAAGPTALSPSAKGERDAARLPDLRDRAHGGWVLARLIADHPQQEGIGDDAA